MSGYILLLAFVVFATFLIFRKRRVKLSDEYKCSGNAGRVQQSMDEIENIKDKYLQFFR
jgi:hypothetical protein